MASCLLYHGPDARSAALKKAEEAGRLLAPPFGDEGLKVDEAREAMSLLFSTPVGTKIGVVVIGPMDQANPKASDVLLKRVEDFEADIVLPILWAHDIGGVSLTIRSRCLAHWAPRTVVSAEDEALKAAGQDAIGAVLNGDFYLIPGAVEKGKGKEIELLGYMTDALYNRPEGDEKSLKRIRVLWERLRPVTRRRNPTPIEIIAALVSDE